MHFSSRIFGKCDVTKQNITFQVKMLSNNKAIIFFLEKDLYGMIHGNVVEKRLSKEKPQLNSRDIFRLVTSNPCQSTQN